MHNYTPYEAGKKIAARIMQQVFIHKKSAREHTYTHTSGCCSCCCCPSDAFFEKNPESTEAESSSSLFSRVTEAMPVRHALV